ncbi:hypothetical protein [Sphaerotilus sp.]|jgi:hypothetical protein|uniref:hypothetical protein n=1 Tax=Sphaerotilus sp. TaxID=2093942 RepID=UPI00286E60D4|nr:hypothetical protein [Sphaerotilus sp.]
MKKLITVMALALAGLSSTAYAADTGCAAKAGEKKLAGAAKNSFMKKCEREAGGGGAAQNACDAKAAEKKLAGAAKNSFVKKCVKDAG